MAIEVPASLNKFLQIRPLAFIDFALGLVSFVFQVALSAEYGFPRDAAGIWCGIVFGLAGFSALNALRNSQNKNFKLAAVGLACLAFVFSIVLLGLASAGIDFFRSVPASFLNAVDIVRALLAIILICSIVAVPVNAFLSIALYNMLD